MDEATSELQAIVNSQSKELAKLRRAVIFLFGLIDETKITEGKHRERYEKICKLLNE